jgi:hypothetical protein
MIDHDPPNDWLTEHGIQQIEPLGRGLNLTDSP